MVANTASLLRSWWGKESKNEAQQLEDCYVPSQKKSTHRLLAWFPSSSSSENMIRAIDICLTDFKIYARARLVEAQGKSGITRAKMSTDTSPSPLLSSLSSTIHLLDSSVCFVFSIRFHTIGERRWGRQTGVRIRSSIGVSIEDVEHILGAFIIPYAGGNSDDTNRAASMIASRFNEQQQKIKSLARIQANLKTTFRQEKRETE